VSMPTGKRRTVVLWFGGGGKKLVLGAHDSLKKIVAVFSGLPPGIPCEANDKGRGGISRDLPQNFRAHLHLKTFISVTNTKKQKKGE